MKTTQLTRRQFLRIVAVGGTAGLAIKLGIDQLDGYSAIEETRLLMGTVVNITMIADNREKAMTALQACLERMLNLEVILSRFIPGSQLSWLNREGFLCNPHPAMVRLIRQSIEMGKLTGGAFDITVKPLVDLYQSSPGVLPTTHQINILLPLVDYRHIDCDTRKISFHQSGMSITLDGIAKGYIIDEAVAVLKEYGFYNVMVEAGGDLIGLGEKAPRTPWKIGLQSPRSGIGDFLAIFNLQDQALATSGDYMQPFTPDFSNHHILDPSSGVSSRELASASVFAPSAALADGLATALMVMGTSGLQVLEYLPGCQAYLVTKDMQVLTTPGFQTAC